MKSKNDPVLGGKPEVFRKFLEFVPDAVVISDKDGKIVLVNSQAEKLLGYREDELLDQAIEVLVPRRFRRAHPGQRAKYMADPHVRPLGAGLDLYALRKDGADIPVEISLAPMETDEGTLVVAAIRDVTERKRAQQTLEKAHAELERRVAERTAELRSSNELLQKEMAERKRLESEIIAVSEREQQRIGRDLHDGLGQTLTAVSYKAKLIEEQLTDHIAPQPEDARKIITLVSECIGQARSLARGLYPVELAQHGLAGALKELASSVTQKHQIPCAVEYDEAVQIKHDTATQVYRIAQEAVTNAIRHANPKKIAISLEKTGGGFALSVRDDGKGLPGDRRSDRGMGLHIMEYRAGVIGGKLRISSPPGGGTWVLCSVKEAREPRS